MSSAQRHHHVAQHLLLIKPQISDDICVSTSENSKSCVVCNQREFQFLSSPTAAASSGSGGRGNVVVHENVDATTPQKEILSSVATSLQEALEANKKDQLLPKQCIIVRSPSTSVVSIETANNTAIHLAGKSLVRALQIALGVDGRAAISIGAYAIHGASGVTTCLLTGAKDLVAHRVGLLGGVVPRGAAFVDHAQVAKVEEFLSTLRGSLEFHKTANNGEHLVIDAFVKTGASPTPEGRRDAKVERIMCVRSSGSPVVSREELQHLFRSPHSLPTNTENLLGGLLGGDWRVGLVSILSSDAAHVEEAVQDLELVERITSITNVWRSDHATSSGSHHYTLRQLCNDVHQEVEKVDEGNSNDNNNEKQHMLQFLEGQLATYVAEPAPTVSAANSRSSSAVMANGTPTPQQRLSNWRRHETTPSRSPSQQHGGVNGGGHGGPPNGVAKTSHVADSPRSPSAQYRTTLEVLEDELAVKEQEVFELTEQVATGSEVKEYNQTENILLKEELDTAKHALATAQKLVAAAADREEELKARVIALEKKLTEESNTRADMERRLTNASRLEKENEGLKERIKTFEEYSPPPPTLTGDSTKPTGPVMPEVQRDARQRAKIADLQAAKEVLEMKHSLLEARLTEVTATMADKDKEISFLKEEVKMARAQAQAAKEQVAEATVKERSPSATAPEGSSRIGTKSTSPPLAPRRTSPATTTTRATTSPRPTAATSPQRTAANRTVSPRQPSKSADPVPPIGRSMRRADTPPKISGVTPRTASRVTPVRTNSGTTRTVSPPTTTRSTTSPSPNPVPSAATRPRTPATAGSTGATATATRPRSPAVGTTSAAKRPTTPGGTSTPVPFKRSGTPTTTSSRSGVVGSRSSVTSTPTATRRAATPTGNASSVSRVNSSTPKSVSGASVATSSKPPRVASPAQTRAMLASAGFMQPTTAAAKRQQETTMDTRPTRYSSPTALQRLNSKQQELLDKREKTSAAAAPPGTAETGASTVQRTTGTARPTISSAMRPKVVTPVLSSAPPKTQMKYPTTYRPTRMVRHQEWEKPK